MLPPPPSLRRIDSSKGNSYPLTGRNSLRGEILKRRGPSTSRRDAEWSGAKRRSVSRANSAPKLMPVLRSNLSADPVYYGTRSPFADEWPTISPRKAPAISPRAVLPYLRPPDLRGELTSRNYGERFPRVRCPAASSPYVYRCNGYYGV